jgi:ATP-dependent DNA helicase RecQ
MRLKVLTLRLDPRTGTFDEGALAEFQQGKDVLDVSEHFLIHDKTPTLALVIRYRDLPENGRTSPEAARKDWRAELDENGKKIYDELRLWRGRKAKREGMPPYLILNNRELAELAMRRPASVGQLREIEGIGEAKARRWGDEIVALLAKLASAARASPPTPTQNMGGGVIYGLRRASALRPLGKDSQGPPLAHGEVPQERPVHALLAH